MTLSHHSKAFLTSLLAVVLLGDVTAAAASERLALLIGNSRYEHATPLRNPENDIALVEHSLKKAGFRTFSGRNLNRTELEEKIETFSEAARKARRPTLLVYFAGHGMQVSGRNYLIPIDAKLDNRAGLPANTIDAEDVLDRLGRLDTKLVIFVLDACRDDPFDKRTRGFKRGLTTIKNRSGKLIAFSTAPGQVALDGDAGTSPYASAFAEAILVPGLELEGVFRRVRHSVVERTSGQQEPWERSAIFQPFVFVDKKDREPLGKQEGEIWKFAAAINSAESYMRYLEMFPKGLFANLAKLKVDAINKDFSYRRKAELFPIIRIPTTSFPKCGPKMFGVWTIFNKLSKYTNQLIYLELALPARTMFCRFWGGAKESTYEQFTRLRGKSGCPDYYSIVEPGRFDAGRIPCRSVEQARIWFGPRREIKRSDKTFRHVFAMGGLHYSANDIDLVMPADAGSHWRVVDDTQEGQIDYARIVVSGLVKVHSAFAEEHIGLYLEPVDPKAVGLSWKFDNTVDAARRGGTDVNVVTLNAR